jgi:hypothetical protein
VQSCGAFCETAIRGPEHHALDRVNVPRKRRFRQLDSQAGGNISCRRTAEVDKTVIGCKLPNQRGTKDVLARRVLASHVSAAGAQAVTAFSLSQALELIEGRPWAGAVLDYWLDGQDCSPLCQQLLNRAIPFIIHTGYQDVIGPYPMGLKIEKPANADDIVRTLAGR